MIYIRYGCIYTIPKASKYFSLAILSLSFYATDKLTFSALRLLNVSKSTSDKGHLCATDKEDFPLVNDDF